jgi:hypothetical protein
MAQQLDISSLQPFWDEGSSIALSGPSASEEKQSESLRDSDVGSIEGETEKSILREVRKLTVERRMRHAVKCALGKGMMLLSMAVITEDGWE